MNFHVPKSMKVSRIEETSMRPSHIASKDVMSKLFDVKLVPLDSKGDIWSLNNEVTIPWQ